MIPISKKFKHLRENENVKNLDRIGCDYLHYKNQSLIKTLLSDLKQRNLYIHYPIVKIIKDLYMKMSIR